jgi:hypothetical protein
MEKSFTVSVEISPEDLTQNINKIVLKSLKKKYENVCWGHHFITEVLNIEARGNIEFSRNKWPTMPFCDVIFRAKYITYARDQQVALRIKEIVYDMVQCENDHIIAQMPVSALDGIFKPAVGLYFVALVDELNYQNFSKITMNISPWVPFAANMLTRIVPGEVDPVLMEAIEKCVKNIGNVKGLEKYFSIFRRQNKARIDLPKKTIFEAVKGVDKNSVFVARSFDPMEEGIYYIGPDDFDLMDGLPVSWCTEAVPLAAVVYRYAVNVHDFVVMMRFFSKMTDEEFKKNEVVWKVYRA